MTQRTPITNLGAITADSITHSGTGNTAITIPSVSTADTLATLNAEQILTNKTLTTPVIDSITTEDGGSISLPTVASGSTATLATTNYVEDELSFLNNNIQNSGITAQIQMNRIDRLLSYLENWISVGNLSMSGVSNYANYGDGVDFGVKNVMGPSMVNFAVDVIPSGASISKITFTGKVNEEITEFTTNNNVISFDLGTIDLTSSNMIVNCKITLSNGQYISNVPIILFTVLGFCFGGTLTSPTAG